MQRTLVSALTWLVVALPSVGVVAAQSDAPTPYAEYRAGVEAFQTAGESSSDGQMPTVEAVIESFSANIDRTRAEVGRLMAITPEPCYADAHAEMIAFREYVIVTYRDTLPLIEDAESVMGMFPMLLAADATVRAAHPAAYVPDESNMTGFRLEPPEACQLPDDLRGQREGVDQQPGDEQGRLGERAYDHGLDHGTTSRLSGCDMSLRSLRRPVTW